MARHACSRRCFLLRCECVREKRVVSVQMTRPLVDDVEAQLQAAQAGRGVARVLSYQVSDELAAGSLVRLVNRPQTHFCQVSL
jgi:DNA-binding transcriptional LysR family regulator